MADKGKLHSGKVVDVQVDKKGIIHHLVKGKLPEIGAEVTGKVDRKRRRLHMALHTAQHLLSKALIEVAGAETLSARLGERLCTLDVNSGNLSESDIAKAEELVNSIIDSDRMIRAYFPTPTKLKELKLRRDPKVEDNIRVVEIDDFDVTPCGGTHCESTAQVGVLKVSNVERYKGNMRLSFSAGSRARSLLKQQSDLLKTLALSLTCGPEKVLDVVSALRGDLIRTRQELKQVQSQLAKHIADDLLARNQASQSPFIIATLPDITVDILRRVGQFLTQNEHLVIFLASPQGDHNQVLVARGSKANLDCAKFLKRAAELNQGRGGGRPHRAEGLLPEPLDWSGTVTRVLTEK